MTRSLMIAIFALIQLLLISSTSVYACSGGNPPANINWMLSESDVVVTGYFVELDELHRNGIFQVDTYLVGSGAEYLLLALNNNYTLFSRLVMQRSSSGDCGGPYSNAYSMDAHYIIFLKQRIDGAFDPLFTPLSMFADHTRAYYEFASEDISVQVLIEDYNSETNTSSDIHEWNFNETVAYINAQLGTTATVPDTNQAYPLTRPLLLSLESSAHGKSYAIVPVTASAPVRIDEIERLQRMRDVHQCSAPPCTVFSYSGVDSVQLLSQESSTPENAVRAEYNYTMLGQRIIASPTSDTFAVWQANRILVYSIMYPTHGFNSFEMEEVTAIDVSITSLNYPAVWSNDGRYLAYSDDEGLYLWDVFTPNSNPTKILSMNDGFVPTVRYFSPMGRYLALTEGATRFTYDLVSGSRFPDGLVSPDDRSLLTFDTNIADRQSISLQRFVPFSEPFPAMGGVSGIQWLDGNHILLTECGRGYYRSEEEYIDEDWCGVNKFSLSYFWNEESYHFATGDGIHLSFNYDELNGNMAVVENNRQLFINATEIDLSQWLEEDEQIVGIEWMPSLFFHSN